MLENKFMRDDDCKEAVCVDAGRVYDSCADKDCAEDLPCVFTDRDQQLIDCCSNARAKKAEVVSIFIDVEPLPFNKGYYMCHVRFFIEVTVEVYTERGQPCTNVCGICTFEKQVTLFGSEGNVKVYCSELSDGGSERQEMISHNLPRCCVQVAEPVVLDSSLVEPEHCKCCCDCICCGNSMPESISVRYNGRFTDPTKEGKVLLVSLGIFSICQMTRNVQMLMPMYDFCMPSKECGVMNENPCDMFKKMNFPVDEFFPPRTTDYEGVFYGSSCGC